MGFGARGLVSVVFDGDTIGMGRIIGDGGCFFRVVDIAVLPEHQGKGLGKRIMKALTDHLSEQVPLPPGGEDR